MDEKIKDIEIFAYMLNKAISEKGKETAFTVSQLRNKFKITKESIEILFIYGYFKEVIVKQEKKLKLTVSRKERIENLDNRLTSLLLLSDNISEEKKKLDANIDIIKDLRIKLENGN